MLLDACGCVVRTHANPVDSRAMRCAAQIRPQSQSIRHFLVAKECRSPGAGLHVLDMNIMHSMNM